MTVPAPVESAVGVVNQTGPGTVQVDVTAVAPFAGGINYRQVMVIGDPSNAAGLAPVDSIAGLTVQSPQLSMLIDVFQDILRELQEQTDLLGGLSPTR